MGCLKEQDDADRFNRREQREQDVADSIRKRYLNSNLWIVYLNLVFIAKFYLRKYGDSFANYENYTS